ncbi:MAG: cupin domain-containing protein [Thermodesulfobacteriota bacterium]
MKTIALDQVPKAKMVMEGAEKVFKQLPISRADGSPSFSFRVFTIEPGGHTPYHSHDFEHLNFIIKGFGALIDEKGKEHPVKEGDFALVLPGEKHQYRNLGTDNPLIMICAVPKEYE